MLRALALTAFALGALSIAVGPVLGDTSGGIEASGEPNNLDIERMVQGEASPDTGRIAGLKPVDGPIYSISIDREIELGLAAYVRRSLRMAKEAGAGALVLHINTPGGRVDATLEIKDALLDSDLPTIALVNRQAFSAGALIGIAAEKLYMVPGSSIGAAAPVHGDGRMAGEKMVSALRTAFASTAERRGRDSEIAKAMVDESVSIDGLTESGKLLTLTHDQAIATGLADGTVASFDALIEGLGAPADELVRTDPTLAERIVRFLTNPVVASLLMSLGFLGMFFELQSPGFGLGGTVAVACLGLYFWGHHLAGLAGWESAILIGVGVALMAVEVFVIPGFGVFGLLGLGSFVTGLFLSRMSQWGLPGEVVRAFYVVSASLLLMVAGAWAMLANLPRNRFFSKVVLLSAVTGPDENEGEGSIGPPWGKSKAGSYRGRSGVALTDLRPAGTVEIDGEPVDVVTEGRFLEAGAQVEVIEDTGNRRVVRPLDTQDESA